MRRRNADDVRLFDSRPMAARSYLCLDPGERHLQAVSLVVDGGTATVERALVVDVPGDVVAPEGDAGDVDALGRWIADALRRAGFPGDVDETIVVLDREQATIRRIDLPTDDPDELPDMARLAMLRETPVEAGALAVDLVPRETRGATTTVLVAAAPAGSVHRLLRLAGACGRQGAVVSLRAFGTARLLAAAAGKPAPAAGDEPGIVAAFDCSGEACELLVVRGGELVHSRGVRTADDAAAASEAKRSWLGYRLAQAGERLGAAHLLAPASIRAAVAPALEKALGAPLGSFEPGPSVRVAASVDREALGRAWPLVGLALERHDGGDTINLAAPRKAPDLAARRRLRLLAGGGVLVLAALAGWTLGNLSRQSFAAEVATLTNLATGQLRDFHRFKRDEYKLGHLRAWESAQPEWLEEARIIHGFAPDTTKVVLDSFLATLEASDVQYRDRAWKIAADLKISLTGEAKDRATADAFRDVLVENGRYTVTSTGADTEGGRRLGSPFLYVLRAKAASAAQDKAAPPEPAKEPAKDSAKDPAKDPAGGGS